MAWLPFASTTVEPARLDMKRWAGGGIILSSVAIKYQLGLVFHAGSLIVPLSASMPHGTWESAMNAAVSGTSLGSPILAGITQVEILRNSLDRPRWRPRHARAQTYSASPEP